MYACACSDVIPADSANLPNSSVYFPSAIFAVNAAAPLVSPVSLIRLVYADTALAWISAFACLAPSSRILLNCSSVADSFDAFSIAADVARAMSFSDFSSGDMSSSASASETSLICFVSSSVFAVAFSTSGCNSRNAAPS